MKTKDIEVKDLDEFARRLVNAASIPRSRRAGRNHVVVKGEVRVLPRIDRADQIFYNLGLEFIEQVNGNLQTRALYNDSGNHNEKEDGPFNRERQSEVLNDVLVSLSGRVDSYNRYLGKTIDEGRLVLNTVGHTSYG